MAAKGPKKRDPAHHYLRWVAGTAASGVMMYLMVFAIERDVSLQPTIILAMLGLITLLLYGPDAIVNIIEAWRGE